MVKWIRYEIPGWRRVANPVAAKLHIPLIWWDKALLRADAAARAFNIFGPEAKSAISDLARTINDPKGGWGGQRAVNALAEVGASGLPPLLAALEDPRAPNRWLIPSAVGHVHSSGVDIIPAVTVLLACVKDNDLAVVKGAEGTLDLLARDQPLAYMSALTNSLQSPNQSVRLAALEALRGLGERASSAVPALLRSLKDPDAAVRSASTNAVRAIAPEHLGKAP